MNFLIDQNLPAAKELFSEFGALHFYEGRELPSELLAEAEILLIRSVTKITEEVLAKAPKLKFVGTATIGTDHMDLNALAARNITFANAAGCNAVAVGEYVLSAALAVSLKHQFSWHGKRALVIGAGNTGSEAGKRLAALGMQVAYIDPIKQEAGTDIEFSSWQQLAEFDLVTCHVPMQRTGPFTTWHLFNTERLNTLKPGALLVNASRGAVVDNDALYQRLQRAKDIYVALDVWEGEPKVMRELVPLVDIATPHIAGHSIEGKIRGTYRLYLQLHELLNLPAPIIPERRVLPGFADGTIEISRDYTEADIIRWVNNIYAIDQDDSNFRRDGLSATGFDKLRKEYALRRELWSQILVCAPECSEKQQKQLEALGFSVRAA
ncbi:phosphoglycerate dehydrogenase-like oxidoreductase [Idiomarina sp. A28L]|uniref:4-phosphoerythronate dehydrogenase n=1 Tax=Idiomarina sp. A28L TaxID=1036674 RepID=UPI0002138E69|nr:4-phosphoerythronate dehydrogenase [Idiomarina sp. A28L]EGN76304.1 phosphoglycerate dehydrogenase-like oxidoreductase [Idiomarina sp. A28L]